MSILSTILIAGTLLSNSHDVTGLGAWGPYSKQYSGISYINDIDAGIRFDFTVVPGFYRRSYHIPNVRLENGCHPWKVNDDMTEITYRYELEWKDRVYVDATYYVVDDNHVLVGMNCVNNTSVPQNLSLQGVSSLHYAEQYPRLLLSGADFCVNAVDYDSYEPAVRQHNHNLVYDGWMRGEKREANTLSGSAIETSGNKGDVIQYTFPESSRNVKMRCRVEAGKQVHLSVNGRQMTVVGKGRYDVVSIGPAMGKVTIETLSDGKIRIDSFFAGEGAKVESKKFVYRPQMDEKVGEYILKYEDQPNYYGLAWNYGFSEVRLFDNSSLGDFMKLAVHNHPPKYLKGDQKGFYTSAFVRPVILQPQTDTTVWFMLAQGDRKVVDKAMAAFHADEKKVVEDFFASRQANAQPQMLPAGQKYALSHQILKATLLTNVVYPVYTQKQYIRHFTPGKWWNSLYTWDLGFISWALNDIDPNKAFETIRAYTTEDGAQSAFIHHGTPLPIQFFAFSDLVTKTTDKDMMKFMYPRLKQYYDYMLGKDGTSTTMMPSGLIRTWDYFYSTGGWDDYPPQHRLITDKHLYPHVAPMVSTSYYLRAGKILRMLARYLGLKQDEQQYDKDIKAMSRAILENAWDEETGYFGYVMHDENGRPTGIYRYDDGSNFNMGLDGVSPLMAGICPPDIRDRLMANIFSTEKLWTSVGVATVDKTASYYSADGYWNGCVWFPHQMMLWKTMLDNAMPEKANQIAFTALDVWKKECDESYLSFEHFIVGSGRGAGWHNFSGLSSPISNWYCSYFKKGTITTGFDAMVIAKNMASDYTSCEFTLEFDKDAVGRDMTVMVCLDESKQYSAAAKGKELQTSSPYPGLLCIIVKADKKPVTIYVK